MSTIISLTEEEVTMFLNQYDKSSIIQSRIVRKIRNARESKHGYNAVSYNAMR